MTTFRTGRHPYGLIGKCEEPRLELDVPLMSQVNPPTACRTIRKTFRKSKSSRRHPTMTGLATITRSTAIYASTIMQITLVLNAAGIRMTRLLFALFASAAACSISCTHKNVSMGYSGHFRVDNDSDIKIGVGRAEGFGRANPSAGIAPPGARCELNFGWLDEFPKSCVMVWTEGDFKNEDSATIVKKQELNLDSVVPKNTKGIVVFRFTKERLWTAHFEQ